MVDNLVFNKRWFSDNFDFVQNYFYSLQFANNITDLEIKKVRKVKNMVEEHGLINNTKRKRDFLLRLELILLKHKNQQAGYNKNYILGLLKKEEITENDLKLFFDITGDAKNSLTIFTEILSKVKDISNFSIKMQERVISYCKNYNFIRSVNDKIALINHDILEIINHEEIDFNSLVLVYSRLFTLVQCAPISIPNSIDVFNNISATNEIISLYQKFEDTDFKKLELLLINIKKTLLRDSKNEITNNLINSNLSLDTGLNYSGNIILPKNDSIPLIDSEYPIITLDDTISPDLDSGFYISKINDLFIFNVYVTDVPSFLDENKNLSLNSYKQGSSFYLRCNGKIVNFDMLPQSLSHKTLSLKKDSIKSTICFQFIFDKNGNICDVKVDRRKIKVDYNITKKDVIKILNDNNGNNELKEKILLLEELITVVNQNIEFNDLKLKSGSFLYDMVAFPSLMINYYAWKNMEYGLYRDNGKYVTRKENSNYLRIGAPLRRYADDINLAILLTQIGIKSFTKDDFNFLLNNLEEIANHLTKMENIQNYLDKNSSFVRKYYKKIGKI